MSCVRIVVADHRPVFLRGLISILDSEHTFDVVASCCDGMQSLRAIRDLAPDIALLNSSMPVLSGIKVLASAISEGSPTRIVLLTTAAALPSIYAISMGAYGVVPVDVWPEILVRSLHEVAAGQRLSLPAFPAGGTRSGARNHTAETTLATLTERERQIVNLVSRGLPNKEVGQRLNLTAGTIKVHLHNIYQKLAINNRTALTALAVSNQYGPQTAIPSRRRLRTEARQADSRLT
jgi:two-component system, NarL family, nitrate/nitrite response regulator NarL